MGFVNAGWVRVPEAAGTSAAALYLPENKPIRFGFENTIAIEQAGYVYIWVSNQSEQARVWFACLPKLFNHRNFSVGGKRRQDDLTVTHTQTMVTQAADYGVWGDVLREMKAAEFTYRFGYQGQFAEKDEETGWNHFELREYDAVIGRWTATDPAGQYYSPYLSMGNNPANHVDPDGGRDDVFASINGKRTVIVKTNDNFDRLFIDGEFSGIHNKGWGLSTFFDAMVFDNYSPLAYVSAFGDQLQNENFFFKQLDYVRSREQQGALYGARVATRDPTILYAVAALAAAPIVAGELIAISPVIASGASQLGWDAAALYNAGNLVSTQIARRAASSLATYARPVLLSPAVGTAAWKAGHKIFVELIHFGRKGNVDVGKATKGLYDTFRTVDKVIDH
jgi:RHS repeat-associated protein